MNNGFGFYQAVED